MQSKLGSDLSRRIIDLLRWDKKWIQIYSISIMKDHWRHQSQKFQEYFQKAALCNQVSLRVINCLSIYLMKEQIYVI